MEVKDMEERHRYCLRLPEGLDKRLMEISDELGIPKNTLIQIAVRRLVEDWKATRKI